VEYQREGFDMFAAVMDGIKEESVAFLFNLEVQVEEDEPDPELSEELEPMRAELPSLSSDPGLIDLSKQQQAQQQTPQIRAKGLDRPKQPQNLSYSAPSEQGEVEVASGHAGSDDEFSDVGRNQLCPCGSGKKYKRCHGAPGGPTGLTARVS
jgi:preprotein translocase subunit SecA